jgi:hypothetical protein
MAGFSYPPTGRLISRAEGMSDVPVVEVRNMG